MAEWTRRAVLALVAGLGVGGGGWLAAVRRSHRRREAVRGLALARGLAEELPLARSAVEHSPRGGDFEARFRRLFPDAGGDPTPADLGAALDSAVARDFASERVVLLEGWILAESEARFLALVAYAETAG